MQYRTSAKMCHAVQN